MRRLATVLFMFLGAALAAQTPPRAIVGRVVAAATGDAVRHAIVAIAGGSGSLPATLTDEGGQFHFGGLPAGRFTIAATKPGFAKTSAIVDFAAESTPREMILALPRGAALAGTLLDEFGEPLLSEGVNIIRVTERANQRPEERVVSRTFTDDLGGFRFGSLAAGTYVIDAGRFSNGRPALRASDAPRFVVQPGDERSGIVVVGSAPSPSLPPLRPAGTANDPTRAIVVRGRITRSAGAPAARAVVQLLPLTPDRPSLTQADDQGRYELVIPQAREDGYRISAAKPGYIRADYGALSENRRGAVLLLKPGDTREDIDIALKKISTIAGRVLDDLGDPVEGAIVHAAQVRYVDGQRKLVDAPNTIVRTDDLGRYRLPGLRAGQYALLATVGQIVRVDAASELPGYGTTYFPGTTNPLEIQLLSVGSAQELTDVDIRMVREKTFRISGHASASGGDPVTGGIGLTPRRRSGSIAAMQMGARISPDGGFEFLNVPPGEYVLQVARGQGRSAFSEGEFAYRFIDVVDADVTEVEMQTAAGSTITGRLTFDSAQPPSLARMELSAMPVDPDRTPNGQAARARVQDDGMFELGSIHGPRRLQVTQPPSGWMMKAVIVNGIDVTDEPLPFGRDDQSLADVEVMLTSRATRIAGRIAESRDLVMSDLAVLAFSSRRDQWYLNTRYIRRTVPKPDGTFVFEGFPPGEYFVMAAYPPDDPGEWRDPDLLEKMALQATRARLSDGQTVSVDLRVR